MAVIGRLSDRFDREATGYEDTRAGALYRMGLRGLLLRARRHRRGRALVSAMIDYTETDEVVDAYLVPFARAYAVAMLWANTTTGEGDDVQEVEPAWWQSPSPDWPLEAFDPVARASIEADCESFVRANLEDLRELDPEQCGHDFALTRNHHGAGFWDRGLGDVGQRLTDAAHAYGSSDGWVGADDRVYLD